MKRMLNNIFLTIFNKTAYILVLFFIVTILFISGGIFNVESDKAKILTESAEIPSDIDSAEANRQLEDIENLIDGFDGTEDELAELNKKLELAEARVEAS